MLYFKCRHLSSLITPDHPGLLNLPRPQHTEDTHMEIVQSGEAFVFATSVRCVTFGAVFGVGVLHCEDGSRRWTLLRQRTFSLRPLCKHIKKGLITAYTAAHPTTPSAPRTGQKGRPESGRRLMCVPMQIHFMHMSRNLKVKIEIEYI